MCFFRINAKYNSSRCLLIFFLLESINIFLRDFFLMDGKMTRKSLLALMCISVGLLQGCTNMKKTDSVLIKKDVAQSQQPAQIPALQQCIQDADALVKLDKGFQKDSDELYGLINDAKFYASVSEQTSSTVKSTITPLFEYKINDKCNSISQKLIKEFESRARKADLKNGLAR